MYFCFLIQCHRDVDYTASEMATASLYIAMKMIEKKTKVQIVSRSIFEQLMRINGCENESHVIKCSSQLFETIQTAKSYFCETPTLMSEHIKVMLSWKPSL